MIHPHGWTGREHVAAQDVNSNRRCRVKRAGRRRRAAQRHACDGSRCAPCARAPTSRAWSHSTRLPGRTQQGHAHAVGRSPFRTWFAAHLAAAHLFGFLRHFLPLRLQCSTSVAQSAQGLTLFATHLKPALRLPAHFCTAHGHVARWVRNQASAKAHVHAAVTNVCAAHACRACKRACSGERERARARMKPGRVAGATAHLGLRAVALVNALRRDDWLLALLAHVRHGFAVCARAPNAR